MASVTGRSSPSTTDPKTMIALGSLSLTMPASVNHSVPRLTNGPAV
jgi:hypothetical protein